VGAADVVVPDAGFAAVLAPAAGAFVDAAFGLAFDAADTVVSPVETLSTGDAGVVVVAEAVVVESERAAVLSLLAASFCEHATTTLSTVPPSSMRPSIERDGELGRSKERFIDMLIHSCTLPLRWSLSAWCLL
jgi:hypothetical protein